MSIEKREEVEVHIPKPGTLFNLSDGDSPRKKTVHEKQEKYGGEVSENVQGLNEEIDLGNGIDINSTEETKANVHFSNTDDTDEAVQREINSDTDDSVQDESIEYFSRTEGEKIEAEEVPKTNRSKTAGQEKFVKDKNFSFHKDSGLIFAASYVERKGFVVWDEEDIETQERIAIERKKRLIKEILPLYSATAFLVKFKNGKKVCYLNPGQYDSKFLIGELKKNEVIREGNYPIIVVIPKS